MSENSSTAQAKSESDALGRRDLLQLAGTGVLGAALSVPGNAGQSGGQELELTAKAVGERTVNQGEKLEVELTATNRSATAQQLRIHYREIPPCCHLQGICTISNIQTDPPAQIVSHDDDGAQWKQLLTSGWLWETVEPGETVSPRLTLLVPTDQPPGEQSLAFEGQLGACSDPNGDGSEPVYAADSVEITVEEPQPEFALTVDAGTDRIAPGETVWITPEIHNVGTATGEPTVEFAPAGDSTNHNADHYGEEFDVVSHDDDGARWAVEYWQWDRLEPGETREPVVELAANEALEPGAYTFALIARNPDQATSERQTVTITVMENTALDVAPSTINFGANVVGSTPTADFAVTNTSGESIELTADQTEGIEFVDTWWLLPQFDAAEPPVTIAAGETATFTIRLNTATAFEELGSAAELEIPVSADGENPLSIPVEATIFNEPEVFEELAATARRTRDMFDHEAIRAEAYGNLASAYKNLAKTTKELGIGSTDYFDAWKAVDAFVANIQSIGKYSAIKRALDLPDDGMNGGTSSEFDDNYADYKQIAKNLETAGDALDGEVADTEQASNKFRDARFEAAQLAADWDSNRPTVNSRHFKDALESRPGFGQAETVVNDYGEAIDKVANIITLTTPMLVFTASPVQTTVTDPEGRTISPDSNEIPGASYREIAVDGAEASKELISIEDRQPGAYQIDLEPENGTAPDETYSLGVSVGGRAAQKATNEPIGEIPSDGYTVGAVSGDRANERTNTNTGSDRSMLTVGGIVATALGAGYVLKRRLTDDQPPQ